MPLVAKIFGASVSKLKLSAKPSVSDRMVEGAGGDMKMKPNATGSRAAPTELRNFQSAQPVWRRPGSYGQREYSGSPLLLRAPVKTLATAVFWSAVRQVPSR